jgi:hypothetical protein
VFRLSPDLGVTQQNPENDNLILPEPSQSIPKAQCIYDILPEPKPNTGHGMRAHPPPGTYKNLHNGTQASVATVLPEAFACVFGTQEMDSSFEGADLDSDTQVDRWEHEPLLALAGSMGT